MLALLLSRDSDPLGFSFSEARDADGFPALVEMPMSAALMFAGRDARDENGPSPWVRIAAETIVLRHGACRIADPGCAGRLDPTDLDALGLEACRPCVDRAGLENEHADGHHDDEPDSDCHECPAG